MTTGLGLGVIPFIVHPIDSLGMISHKKSLITIFGQKQFMQKFHQKFDIFHEKISTASN